MWLVRNRQVYLTYASGKLFRAGVAALTRRLLEHDVPGVGCPPFDRCSVPQRLACLEIVAGGLLSRGRATAFPTLWTDAAVAAVMMHVEQAMEGRTHFEPDLLVPWRRLVRKVGIQKKGAMWWMKHESQAQLRMVRLLRLQWTTLDWRWLEASPSPAGEVWADQGHALFLSCEFARKLPEAFFTAPPPDPSAEQTGQHRAYLLGLGRPGRRPRAARHTAAEPSAPAARRVLRVARRINL